ncbi:hypothetical protein MKX01_014085, partial [Papaver californicum]
FDAIDLTGKSVVDDEPDKIDVDELEAIATDITIPIFENQTQRNHNLPQIKMMKLLLIGMSLLNKFL